MNHDLRVRIRPYRVDDAAALTEAAHESVAEVQPWMPWCHPGLSLEDTRAWLQLQVPAFQNGEAFEFAIVSEDGRFLGGCGVNQIDRDNRRANVGYWVRSSAARQGAATASVGLISDWAFAHTDLVRLEIVIACGNAASLRVAEKSGAFREGMLRRRLLLHGVHHDATIFSIVRGG
jgi:ribosomal-protein-serine acetyltransferase